MRTHAYVIIRETLLATGEVKTELIDHSYDRDGRGPIYVGYANGEPLDDGILHRDARAAKRKGSRVYIAEIVSYIHRGREG